MFCTIHPISVKYTKQIYNFGCKTFLNIKMFRCEKEEDLAMIAAQQYYIEFATDMNADRYLYRGSIFGRAGHSLFFFRFALCSALIFLPRIAIALALILQIFRFTHRSIALKKTAVRSWKRALKRSIAPKTTVVRSF